MSNAITTTESAPSIALQIGTKQKPQAFMIDLSGAALTGGKLGVAARATTKGNMPAQAIKGGFATFSGYLGATFPKITKVYATEVASKVKALEMLAAGSTLSEEQAKLFNQLRSEPMRCRVGFDLFIQLLLDMTSAPTFKPSKAQVEALKLVDEYVVGMAAKPAQQ